MLPPMFGLLKCCHWAIALSLAATLSGRCGYMAGLQICCAMLGPQATSLFDTIC